LNGGTASGTIVSSGGSEGVFTGGNAIGTVVNKGGFEEVLVGGTTSGTIVNGGEQDVLGGGTAIGTVVNSGGFEFVGGTAIGTVVNRGGHEVVFNGDTASGTVLSGGTLEILNGGSIGSTPVSFTSAGGILQLDASQSFDGLIAGFASPPNVTEEIDLRDIAFGKGTKLSFKEDKNDTSGTLTVTDGTHTANLTLLGQYSAHDFTLASDLNGGTIITDPQHPPSLVGSAGSPVLAAQPI
jgi:autotransporter passenger strand-loop-strand repeat protein